MCCGGGSKQPQPVSTQVVEQTKEFPEEIKPYITDILGKSQALFGKQSGEGYQVFPGGVQGRIAPLESEQLEALEAYKGLGREGLAGTSLASARPYFESGLAALGGSMGAFGPEQAQQYMNPYQQAVVDIAKREAERSYIPVFQGIGDVFEKSGGFGGSRQAVREAEASRNLQQQLGDIQTRGMQQAFEQGRSAFEQQKAREFAGAGQLFAQGPQAFGQAAREISALEAAGKQERAEDQRTKNLLYEQFQQEQIYPTKTLQEYQSMVRGFPYQPSIYRTEQNLAPSPGIGQQLMGGLGTAASIYGGMGGFSKGGFGSFGQAGGPVGGLASLTNYVSGGQIQGGLRGIEAHQSNVAMPGSKSLDEILGVQDSWTVKGIEEPTLEELEKKKITAGQFWTVADQELLDKKRAYMKKFKSQKGPVADPKVFHPRAAPAPPISPSTGRGTATRDISALESGLSSITDDPRKGLSRANIYDPLKVHLKGLEDIRSFKEVGEKLSRSSEALAAQQGDSGKRIANIKAGIDTAYKPLEDFYGQFKEDLTTFTNAQLAENKLFKTEREAAINKRSSQKLAKLATIGKEAKKTGEQNAMQNLFLNMLLPMSLQAGQDPRGFVAGALQGGQDNMKAFVDRYSTIKDKYATGKEKREREGMDIRDKTQTDIFDMQDKFNARKQQIDSQMFKKSNENKKQIAKTGASKQTERNNADLKRLAMESEALSTRIAALNLTRDIEKDRMTLHNETIKAISTLMDTLGLGDAASKAKNKSPAEQEKIMLDQIENKYNFFIDPDTKSISINGVAVQRNNPTFKEMLKEMKNASSAFHGILKQAGNTDYITQVDARLQILQGGGAGTSWSVTKP